MEPNGFYFSGEPQGTKTVGHARSFAKKNFSTEKLKKKMYEIKHMCYFCEGSPLASSQTERSLESPPQAARALGSTHLCRIRDGVPVPPRKGVFPTADPRQNLLGSVIGAVCKRGKSVQRENSGKMNLCCTTYGEVHSWMLPLPC